MSIPHRNVILYYLQRWLSSLLRSQTGSFHHPLMTDEGASVLKWYRGRSIWTYCSERRLQCHFIHQKSHVDGPEVPPDIWDLCGVMLFWIQKGTWLTFRKDLPNTTGVITWLLLSQLTQGVMLQTESVQKANFNSLHFRIYNTTYRMLR